MEDNLPDFQAVWTIPEEEIIFEKEIGKGNTHTHHNPHLSK